MPFAHGVLRDAPLRLDADEGVAGFEVDADAGQPRVVPGVDGRQPQAAEEVVVLDGSGSSSLRFQRAGDDRGALVVAFCCLLIDFQGIRLGRRGDAAAIREAVERLPMPFGERVDVFVECVGLELAVELAAASAAM